MIHGVALPILILAISFSIFPRIRVPSSVMHLMSSSGSLPVFDMNFEATDAVSSRIALDLRAEEKSREGINLLKFIDREFVIPVMPTSSTVHIESHPVVAHRLPCVVEHDGPAEVSKYFKPNLDEKKASFRGRHLVSSELVLPEQLKIHMMEKSEDGNWKCTNVDKIYQWHHDQVDQSVQNSLYKAADYLDLMSNFVQK